MGENIKTEILFPTRIVEASRSIRFAECLLKPRILQVSIPESEVMIADGRGHVILDFGREVCGSVRILTEMPSGGERRTKLFQGSNANYLPLRLHRKGRIRIRIGESVTEACSELGWNGACDEHSLRDMSTRLVRHSDSIFFNSGFRFVRIDFKEGGRYRIKNVVAVSSLYEAPQIYAYEGDDGRIKDIFDVAKRTIDLCASSGLIWDGIKRDRLVWIGDMFPEVMAMVTLYGRQDIIERSLRFVRDRTPLGDKLHEDAAGRLDPQSQRRLWMNGIPMYSMWWVIILRYYHDRTKCDDFIMDNLPYLAELGTLIGRHVDDSGGMHYHRFFVDWPSNASRDKYAGCRAINLKACQDAIELYRAFGWDDSVWQGIRSRLLKVPIEVEKEKQIIGLKYWVLGEISDKERDLLVDGGAKGMSTFMSYFILNAVSRTSGRETAVNMMKEYYGGMLDRGATSFWEDFDVEWLRNSGRIDERTRPGQKDLHADFGKYCYKRLRHSLCHGWSSGVIAFIEEATR